MSDFRENVQEQYTQRLFRLYQQHGYLPYKMGKFEEYELYIRNKDFLISDQIITFNDTNGKLMALKPDVTLSIIKNGEDCPGVKQRVYYHENVYRVSDSTHRFKEILQTGVECIGDTDLYDIYEVISLAAESLAGFSRDFLIEISNLDLVRRVITSVCGDRAFVNRVLACIAEKNAHELREVCLEYGVGEEEQSRLSGFVSLYGERGAVVSELQRLYPCPETDQMVLLSRLLEGSPYSDRIRFDFSVINDMNYYNGFVFGGFLEGICCGVLTGGQYDNMMKKMHRQAGAIGFAIYLDRIGELFQANDKTDVDCLLLYDGDTDVEKLAGTVRELMEGGSSVSAQKSIPDKLRYRTLVDLRKGER